MAFWATPILYFNYIRLYTIMNGKQGPIAPFFGEEPRTRTSKRSVSNVGHLEPDIPVPSGSRNAQGSLWFKFWVINRLRGFRLYLILQPILNY